MIPALLNYPSAQTPLKERNKTHHHVQPSPLGNGTLNQYLDILLGADIAFDRLALGCGVLLGNILGGLMGCWFVDIGDIEESALRCELQSSLETDSPGCQTCSY